MSNGNQQKTFAAQNKEEISEFIRNQELKHMQCVEDLRHLMTNPRFRRFSWWFLELAIVNANPFTGNSETSHILGRQASANKLRKVAETECPDEFLMMIKENSPRQQTEKKKEHKQVKEV